jgi:tRNA modification GTPase
MEEIVRGLGVTETLFVETKTDVRDGESFAVGAFCVSAATGAGLAELKAAIAATLDARYGRVDYESPVITHARHEAALKRAADELSLFVDAMEKNTTPTIAAVHLRAAVAALEEIIGAVSVDDLLDEVFSRFCIGK